MTESNGRTVRIGVDIGGTFTDLAIVDSAGRFQISKVLTTHGDEQSGVLAALDAVDADPAHSDVVLAHGTTLVINALLERTGARTALVTTAGFGDIIEIARGSRPEMFNLTYHRDPPLVPAEMRFEIAERCSADGEVLRRPTAEELDGLVARVRGSGAEAVAVAFVNSYARPDNERLVAEHLRASLPGVQVTASTELSRQWREYERFTSATANAYVGPVAHRYVRRLADGLATRDFAGEFVVLDSSGGALPNDLAARLPVRVVESGPVAGVIGAGEVARDLGIDKMVTFDMGGTTAKTALVEDGRTASTDLYWIGGYDRGFPLQVSTVDIIEIGAGGGSIAWSDETGRLRVGPRSAGSQPGPACYGRGGQDPTITDANLYCGRLDPDNIVGSLRLDRDAAERALAPLADRLGLSRLRLALGILKVGTLSMAAAVRRQTLEKGRDPREFAMIALGGAGPMHACEVAAEVGIRQVVVPRHPGHFCAMGMLGANLRLDRTEIVHTPLDALDWSSLTATIERAGKELADDLDAVTTIIGAEPALSFSLALRYVGQEHTIALPNPEPDTALPTDPAAAFTALFEAEYERRFGHTDPASTIEVVDVQIVVERALPRPVLPAGAATAARGDTVLDTYFGLDEHPVRTPALPRAALAPGESLTGPATIYEEGATTVVPPGATVRVAGDGTLMIDLTSIGARR